MSVAARPPREGDDEREPEAELVLGDRAEQHDEGRGARDDPGRRPEQEESATARPVVVVVVVVVRVAPAPEVPAEHGGSDGDHEDA